MCSSFHHLKLLGWDDRDDAGAGLLCAEGLSVARVIAVDREQFTLADGLTEFRGRLAGRVLHQLESAEQCPCVGDWVFVDRPSPDGAATIRKLLPRRTCLRRKSVGSPAGYQMIAANVDVAIIVQSCHYDFNVNRLERCLAMVREGGVLPAVLLTKTDLVSAEVLAGQIAQIRLSGIDARIVALSNVSREGLVELGSIFVAGKTYCFIGSSGVGKSTIINTLIGREVMTTKSVSATGEGRHQTVRRELVRLAGGALVIDNPGMREFGVLGTPAGIEESFADIEALATRCRYRNCAHQEERDCAVRAASESGAIPAGHYQNFLKLRQETEFAQLSQVERRHKDYLRGRFLKSAKKDLDTD